MRTRGLAVQGAMNAGGGMVRARVDDFRASAERLHALLAPHPPASAALPVLSWVFGGSTKAGQGNAGLGEERVGERTKEDTLRYVRALEDCVAGGVQWLYETSLFFGAQGAEIRAFGWVFADEPVPAPTAAESVPGEV